MRRKKILDHRGLAMKASLAFGYSPASDLMLPRERIEIRTYRKEEDFIPFMLRPLYENVIKYDRTTGEIIEKKKIVKGVSSNPISLDFRQGGGLVLFVSPTGSGKTFALRGLLGDLIEMGYVCFAIDVKNEFISSKKPVQEKFRHLLPPWRRPKGLPIKPIFPAYLQKKRIPKEWIGQIDIKDMKVEDMLTTLNLKPNEAQAQILLTVWPENNNPRTIDKLIWRVARVNAEQILTSLIPKGVKLKPFAERTQATLVRRLAVLKSQRVFGSDHSFDVVDMLRQRQFPILCLDEDIKKKFYHSTYIAVLIRKIYENYKKIGRRIVFILEDAGAFAVPNKANPTCKDIILKQLIPVGRRRGFYIIAAIQNLAQVPEEAISQGKIFIFFGRISGLDLEKIAKIRKKRYKHVRAKMDEYRRYSELPNGMRGSVIWDERGKAELGFIGSPCSWHLEQEK